MLWGRKVLEKGRRYLVDPFIGALGTEDNGNQELKRIIILELRFGIRIDFFEKFYDSFIAFLTSHPANILLSAR
jgi:hypothetical protein